MLSYVHAKKIRNCIHVTIPNSIVIGSQKLFQGNKNKAMTIGNDASALLYLCTSQSFVLTA